ncbi:hypothetical protein GR140_18950 [Pseudomonas putida]|uniref:hypothetical protein n=1 Tax=Pseudomonas putida TaxID=303 RepID=UPI001BAED1E0|nr:hypothetical protein [Pseudomonas putida]QUG90744.1 hypothetical protein GR140_18950 [Pseudomonas putida]
MQRIKLSNVSLWLREQFKKILSGCEVESDLNSLKVLSLLSLTFSSIVSIAIVNFFYFSNIVDDVFHASLSFALSNVLIFSFMHIKVLGFKGSVNAAMVFERAVKGRIKNN